MRARDDLCSVPDHRFSNLLRTVAKYKIYCALMRSKFGTLDSPLPMTRLLQAVPHLLSWTCAGRPRAQIRPALRRRFACGRWRTEHGREMGSWGNRRTRASCKASQYHHQCRCPAPSFALDQCLPIPRCRSRKWNPDLNHAGVDGAQGALELGQSLNDAFAGSGQTGVFQLRAQVT